MARYYVRLGRPQGSHTVAGGRKVGDANWHCLTLSYPLARMPTVSAHVGGRREPWQSDGPAT